ncbi:MAG TPA: hypothetical protein PK999_18665, partial [Nitrospira sp.]|nr:hypothetical protein [Nitrospira sp.]
TIPVAMVVTAEMQARATYKCSRSCFETPNKLGWKVCHIEPVGLHGRASITERPILELQGHFRRLLSPSNMFLVPLILAGLGEIPHFIKAVRCESHVRTEDTLGANA